VASINKMYSRVVEIFKTNVSDVSEANSIAGILHDHFPLCKINFDLDDCDRILRIEGRGCDIDITSILEIVKARHYDIELIID
jgi:hypothetical protein